MPGFKVRFFVLMSLLLGVQSAFAEGSISARECSLQLSGGLDQRSSLRLVGILREKGYILVSEDAEFSLSIGVYDVLPCRGRTCTMGEHRHFVGRALFGTTSRFSVEGNSEPVERPLGTRRYYLKDMAERVLLRGIEDSVPECHRL